MTTDPRKLGGSISGPGGPHDEDAVVIDTENAVLLDATDVAVVGAVRDKRLAELSLALWMQGRINKTDERASVLYLFDADGAAALVTELIGLAARADFGDEFMELVKQRMDAMP